MYDDEGKKEACSFLVLPCPALPCILLPKVAAARSLFSKFNRPCTYSSPRVEASSVSLLVCKRVSSRVDPMNHAHGGGNLFQRVVYCKSGQVYTLKVR